MADGATLTVVTLPCAYKAHLAWGSGATVAERTRDVGMAFQSIIVGESQRLSTSNVCPAPAIASSALDTRCSNCGPQSHARGYGS